MSGGGGKLRREPPPKRGREGDGRRRKRGIKVGAVCSQELPTCTLGKEVGDTFSRDAKNMDVRRTWF